MIKRIKAKHIDDWIDTKYQELISESKEHSDYWSENDEEIILKSCKNTEFVEFDLVLKLIHFSDIKPEVKKKMISAFEVNDDGR